MDRGAGIYCEGDPTIINCHFLDNAVADRGAAMYNDGGNPTLNHCLFTGNSAESVGGAISTRFGSPTLNDCTFSNNSAISSGGGTVRSGRFRFFRFPQIFLNFTDFSRILRVVCMYRRHHKAPLRGGGT